MSKITNDQIRKAIETVLEGANEKKREFDDKNKWVVNEDGSISPKAAPHLAIGAEYDPAKRDPHQRMKREFPDKQRFIIHEDGSVSSKFTPQCFLGLQFDPSPVCAIYEDEEDGNGRAPTTQVRTHVGNVGFLHSLRDSVLTGDFDRRLNEVCRTLEAWTLTPLTAHATLSLCACPITIAHLPRQSDLTRASASCNRPRAIWGSRA